MQKALRKSSVTNFGASFTVHTVPVLKDNFCYIIHDQKTKAAAVVDVSEVKPIVEQLNHLGVASVEKFSILTTHKHWDHSGGNKDMVAQFGSSLKVYGGAKDNVPHVTNPVNDADEFSIGNLKVKVFFSPCHTSGHVLYHVSDPSDASAGSALFSGDTLFVGGIGAFFEGNSQDMLSILDRVAATLPKDTKVFGGHEYTVNFIKFALTMDPDNAFIKEKLATFQQLVAVGTPTIPSTIEDELKFNVFMRTRDPTIIKAVGLAEDAKAVDVMTALYNACP